MKPAVVFFSQATNQIFFDLAAALAREVGPTAVSTATRSAREFPADCPVEVWPAPAYDNASYRGRLVTWLRYLAHASRVAVGLDGRPVLLLSTNPPLLPWLGLACHAARGWPYVVQVLDVYPDVFARRGMLGTHHPVYRAWAALNRLSFARASDVITLGPVMAQVVGQYMPPGREVTVVPTWVDTDAIRPVAKSQNAFARVHGLTDKLTVLYSGNIGLTHDLGGLFAAAKELQSEKDLAFVIIGGGARRLYVEAMARDLANVTVLPLQPEATVPLSMASGDVGVVALERGAEGISMPSKCCYLMAAGCAILGLTHGDNDVARLIAKYECGLNVPADDPAAVRAALARFHGDRAFLARCQRNARAAAERDFSAAACIARYVASVRAAAGAPVT